MTQRALDLFGSISLSPETETLIGQFREAQLKSGMAASTVAVEVSQLRSLARDAKAYLEMELPDLFDRPSKAAELIEFAGQLTGRSTVLTRYRALKRLVMSQLGDGGGRNWITALQSSLPKKKSSGWHDSGLSLPGSRKQVRPRSPTPDHDAIEAILQLAVARSSLDGAIAGLICFSGLELGELCGLRWSDVTWRDDGESAFCEVTVLRRRRRATCLIVPMGARPLLSLALTSGLRPDNYVLPGRKEGEHLSKGAIRNRIKWMCEGAGWPGLTLSQLTAAFAVWLRGRGYDDHSIRLILGRRRTATVDRLLRDHERIASQIHVDCAMEGR